MYYLILSLNFPSVAYPRGFRCLLPSRSHNGLRVNYLYRDFSTPSIPL